MQLVFNVWVQLSRFNLSFDSALLGALGVLPLPFCAFRVNCP
jgi:hypothetical protein